MADIDTFALISGLVGGLALFLFGLDQLSAALKGVAGEGMKGILGRLTVNRVTGALSGAVVTAVMQSSSITTVLTVGFISAGLMNLAQAVPVIMGANVGTTVTAQIIAFKVTEASLPLVALGVAMRMLGHGEKIQLWGSAVLGLGLLFLGMNVMGGAMAPLRDWPLFHELMAGMNSPLLGIAAGALVTALLQASAATTGIIMVLSAEGLLALPGAIALIFGANIGTCVTALLAATGKPREAVRAALVHVLFNIAGVALWLAFIDPLAAWVGAWTPGDLPRQIANVHTVFNVANTMLFLPFTAAMAAVVMRMLPDRPAAPAARFTPRYLQDELVSTPSLALDAVRREIGEMGARVSEMMAAVLPATLTGTRASLDAVAAMDVEVDARHAAIVGYLRRIGLQTLTEAESQRFVRLMEAANALENIGDIVETDLVTLGKRRIEESVSVSQATQRLLREFHADVATELTRAVTAVVDEDRDAARAVIAGKAHITEMADRVALHGAQRLLADEPNRPAAYTREMETVERLRRIYYFAKRIAKTVVAEAGKEEGRDVA